MSAGTVIKRTKGLEPVATPTPEPEPVVPMTEEMSEAWVHTKREREAYMLAHAPRLLAALIVRRSGTGPDQLIDQAVAAAGKLYDYINTPERKEITKLLDSLYGQPVQKKDGWYIENDGPYPSKELCDAARTRMVA